MGLLKVGIGFVVGSGVSEIVTNVVNATMPRDVKKLKRVTIAVGAAAINAYATDKIVAYVDKEIDNLKEAYKDFKDELEKAKNEDEEDDIHDKKEA